MGLHLCVFWIFNCAFGMAPTNPRLLARAGVSSVDDYEPFLAVEVRSRLQVCSDLDLTYNTHFLYTRGSLKIVE